MLKDQECVGSLNATPWPTETSVWEMRKPMPLPLPDPMSTLSTTTLPGVNELPVPGIAFVYVMLGSAP